MLILRAEHAKYYFLFVDIRIEFALYYKQGTLILLMV